MGNHILTSSEMSANVIRLVAYGGTAYLCYSILGIMYWDFRVARHYRKTGENEIVSEEEQEERKNIESYMKNHYGYQLGRKAQATHLIEDQVQLQLAQKMALAKKMKEEGTGDPDLLEKIEVDIQKLNQLNEQFSAGGKGTEFAYPKRDP